MDPALNACVCSFFVYLLYVDCCQTTDGSPIVSNDATERYLSFLESFPALVNRIPLAYDASYVGVTQQSLSRIRRNLR